MSLLWLLPFLSVQSGGVSIHSEKSAEHRIRFQEQPPNLSCNNFCWCLLEASSELLSCKQGLASAGKSDL